MLREIRPAQSQREGEAFGSRLREERKRLHLTQARLAAAVGISAPTQVGYEQGNRTPDAHYLTAIQRLGMDEHYIRTGVHSRRHAAAAMDWDFFMEVQRAGDAWFQKELNVTLDPQESNQIARLLYEMLVDDGEIEAGKIERVLRLVSLQK